MPAKRFTPEPGAIYLVDNGRALCVEHLGSSARTTGRDTSGQRIYRVTDADHRAYSQQPGAPARIPCEDCQYQAARRNLAAMKDGRAPLPAVEQAPDPRDVVRRAD